LQHLELRRIFKVLRAKEFGTLDFKEIAGKSPVEALKILKIVAKK